MISGIPRRSVAAGDDALEVAVLVRNLWVDVPLFVGNRIARCVPGWQKLFGVVEVLPPLVPGAFAAPGHFPASTSFSVSCTFCGAGGSPVAGAVGSPPSTGTPSSPNRALIAACLSRRGPLSAMQAS